MWVIARKDLPMAKCRIVFPLAVAIAGVSLQADVAFAQGGSAADARKVRIAAPRPLPDIIDRPDGGLVRDIPRSDRPFYIHALGRRCVDFGGEAGWAVGNPVYIYECNGTVAQQVRVKEIDDTHDIKLMVASRFCIGVRGGTVALEQPLELQLCDDASPAQRFAFDGDAILIGAQRDGRVMRDYVIAPFQGRTPNRTPLVVTARTVSDAEYFRFEAVDRSGAFPTRGFVRVSTEAQLDTALIRGWGTVIEIDPARTLELKSRSPKQLRAGVTLRGYRKHTFQGPEILSCVTVDKDTPVFLLNEDHVRITGLRLRGPMDDPRCSQANLVENRVIWIKRPTDLAPEPIALIDRLDISYFKGAAVDTWGPGVSDCAPDPAATQRTIRVRVIGNFIHHNDVYGSATGQDAFILIRGNYFYWQKAHAIVSDASGKSGFIAHDNFIPATQHPRETEDIDMHGSEQVVGNHTGGTSGDYFDIGWNTFMHARRDKNVWQRGTPCFRTWIHDNVFARSKDESIGTISTVPERHLVDGQQNTFNASDPTGSLAVGDFDGDGIDDVFVATGQGWYFSSGGQAEWRFLSRKSERLGSLLFGDFDGDGRTDVVALHGDEIVISWGGVSPWQTINVTAWKLSDLAVGDFDGDGRADLFLATGTEWFYAPGGRNWTPLATSSYRRANLIFGDFRRERRTRVLRISGGRWLAAGLNLPWTATGSAPVSSVAGLVVGDFDGDGFIDVARTQPVGSGLVWQYATPAKGGGWTQLRMANTRIASHPIGRFDGNATSDVIIRNDTHFNVAPSGRNPVRTLSRQAMR